MNEVKSPKKPLLYYYFVAMLRVMLFNFIAMPWISEHQIKDVDYNTFVTMTEQGEVGRVEIQEQSNRNLFTSSDEKTVYKTAMVPDDGLVQRLLDAGVSTTGEEIEQTSLLVSILAWVLPIIIFVALGQYMSRKMMEKMGGGGNSMMFNMGKSNAKVYVKSAEGIKFDDVAGEDEAKENLTEVVNYLHDPSKYQEIGASMPKGILLVGPPGTGKTMLAKAVAGEANVPFFSMSGSEFVEMFVGMGASKVRDLFKQAKEKAPWTALRATTASSSSPPRTAPNPLTPRSRAPAASTAACRWSCPTSRDVRPFCRSTRRRSRSPRTSTSTRSRAWPPALPARSLPTL